MSKGEMDIKWMLAYIFMSMNPAKSRKSSHFSQKNERILNDCKIARVIL